MDIFACPRRAPGLEVGWAFRPSLLRCAQDKWKRLVNAVLAGIQSFIEDFPLPPILARFELSQDIAVDFVGANPTVVKSIKQRELLKAASLCT
jgi:hypothetical protein